MKRPVSIRDKFCFKTQTKASFRHLATYDRRALYLRRAFFGEILPPPHLLGKISLPPAFRGKISPPPCLLAKFYLVSAFLGIVPTSTTASFGVKFHFRPQSVFNRAVRFVVKFYYRPRSVQSPLVYRKTPTRNKARSRSTARLLPCRRRAANFKISPALLCSKILPKFYAAFVRLRSKRAAFYRRRDDVF